MASVVARFTFSCPHCDKVLKTAARPAEDKKIKCPACAKAFVPEVDEDDGAIQENPTLKGKSKAASSTSVNGKVARRPRLNDLDNDEPAQKSGGGMLYGLLGCGALVLLLGCGGIGGVTAFVWPGFLRTKTTETPIAVDDGKDKDKGGGDNGNPQKPADDIANFVHANASFVIGVNTKSLREKNQFDTVLKQLEDTNGAPMPPEYRDLFRNSDKVLMSVANGDLKIVKDGKSKKPAAVFAVLASTPDAAAKIKALPMMGKEEMLDGKHRVYRPGKNAPGFLELVAVVGDRLFVGVSDGWIDRDFAAFLDKSMKGDNSRSVAAKQSKLVDLTDFWVAMDTNDAGLRQDMEKNERELPPDFRKFAVALQAMQRMKAASIGVNAMGGDLWKVHLYLDCANANDASTVKNAGEDLKVVGLEELKKLQPPVSLIIPETLTPDLNTLAFQSQDTIASANMLLAKQTFDGLVTIFKLGPQTEVAKNDPKNPFPKDAFPKEKDPFPKEIPFPFPKEKDPFPKEKDPFPKDPLPKPKSKLMNPPTPQIQQTYVLSGKDENSIDERGIHLNKGQRIVVEVTNNTIPRKGFPKNNVDFYVYKGDTSDNRNIIASDRKAIDLERTSHINKVTFDVPETGPYYIKVVNTGPGRASQVIVQIFDVTGKDGPPTDPKDKGKDKDKDKDKAPKLNPKANKPPAVYNVPSFTRGHTDHKLFAFQANKLVTIGIQFNPGFKKVSDIEITVYKGEKGNEVVARQRGSNGIVAVRFTPEATDVYRVHIHNHRDTAIQNQVQVQQQN